MIHWRVDLAQEATTGGAGDDEFDFSSNASTENLMDKITDCFKQQQRPAVTIL